MNLIVPCCGLSKRYGMKKPKWMLTHPDGKPMIYKILEPLSLNLFDDIIITITRIQNELFDSEFFLKSVFLTYGIKNYKICILEKQTKSQSETIYETIKKLNISGRIMIKDSDSLVRFNEDIIDNYNFVVCGNINSGKPINDLSGKSFVEIDCDKNIMKIYEKQIKSEYFSTGLYSFDSSEKFCEVYKQFFTDYIDKEMYLSDIINILINDFNFKIVEALQYEDWGTRDRWIEYVKNYKTYFIDFDGVLVKNTGRFGKKNWDSEFEEIKNNVLIIKKLFDNGAQIIITTSRGHNYHDAINTFLENNGIKPYHIVCGCNHSQRIIINDFADTNPYPSSDSISIERNSDLIKYLGGVL